MSGPATCERWVAVRDREATGERVTPDERRWVSEHESECERCAAEARAWKALPKSLDHCVIDALELEDAQRRVLHTLQRTERARRVRRWAAACAGAAALAAAAYFTVQGFSRAGTTSSSAYIQHSGASAVPDNGNAARVSDIVGCVPVAEGIRACAETGSLVRRSNFSEQNRALELDAGRVVVSLEPQPPGSSFSVKTSAGTITAIGTVFAVEVPAAEPNTAVVRVLEGTVAVQGSAGQVERIGALKGARLHGGVTPFAPESPDLDRDYRLLGEPRPAARNERAAKHQTTPSAREWLERARTLRADARYADAVTEYGKLRASYPRSREAQIALLAIAEIQLSHLAQPAAALRSFQAYVEVGGPLGQEARYGKIRALRKLGRAPDEKREIVQFLRAYPQSVQSSALKARLAQL